MRRARGDAAALLAARVDWLEVAFRVDLDPHTLADLQRAAARSLAHAGPVSVVLGGIPWSCKPAGRAGKYVLTNGSATCVVQEKAPGAEPGSPGWGVVVACHGTELLSLGHRGAIVLAHEIAHALGDVREFRFGRTDLCADVARYGLSPDDTRHYVKQRRVRYKPHSHDGTPIATSPGPAKAGLRGDRVQSPPGVAWKLDGRRVVAILADADGGVCADYYGGDTYTGLGFGGRTSVSVRIYDKRHELRTCSPDKRAAEERAWRAAGWDGRASVARVEFELRGEGLDSLRLRHASKPELSTAEEHAAAFAGALDSAWAYLTQKWIRLGKRGERGYVQHRWREVQRAVFLAAAEPRERERVHGAAKAAQAAGCAVSLLAAVDRLPLGAWTKHAPGDWRLGVDEDVLVDEFLERERRSHDANEEEEKAICGRELAREWSCIFQEASRAVISYERGRLGADDPRAALERLWNKTRDRRARTLARPVVAAALAACAA